MSDVDAAGRMQLEASGINFADILGRMGLYPDLPPIRVVVGYGSMTRFGG